MKQLLLFALVSIMAVSALLAGCGSSSPATTTNEPTQTPQPSQTSTATSTPTSTPTTTSTTPAGPSGTINVGIPDFSYDQFDPNNYTATWGYETYDTLITYDKDGSYAGDVARSWDLSPDGNTWTFHLRNDIYFSDGTQLTARDVKFSVDRFSSSNSTNPWSPYLNKNYDSTSTPDQFTFVYVTQHPEPTLAAVFAATWILPMDYFNRVGADEFNNKPVGSGPWILTDHVAETSITFTANTNYWRGVPAFKTLVINQVPEEATRVAMFKRGELDVVTNISTDRLVEMENSGTQVRNVGLPNEYTLVWPGTWINDGPTSDIRVRQAMSYALNRQEICDTYFHGTATPGGRWFLAPGSWGWQSSWQPDQYDPARAKQLLTDAGYPDAFSTPTIDFYVTATQEDFAQVLQGYWEAIGLDVKITVMESVAWSGIVFVRNEEPTAPQAGGMWMWGPFPAAANAVYQSANMYIDTGVHTTSNDAQATALYNKVASDLDPAQALADWETFLDYAYNMWVNTGTVMIQPLTLVSDKIGTVGRNWISWDDAYATVQHAN
jgi:peptide/nickel transport system substrate-binding protein